MVHANARPRRRKLQQAGRSLQGDRDGADSPRVPKLSLRGPRRLLPTLLLSSTATLAAMGASAQAASAYVDPFGSDVIVGRTDMGVDFCLSPGDPIKAVGDGVVTGIQQDWYAGQPYVWYELTSGPYAGRYVYVAEQIKVAVRVGQTVSAGQVIARFAKTGSCIEAGWSQADGETTAAATTGYTEGQVTDAGVSFARFMSSLGVQGVFELTPTPSPRAAVRSRGGKKAKTKKPAVKTKTTQPATTHTTTAKPTTTGAVSVSAGSPAVTTPKPAAPAVSQPTSAAAKPLNTAAKPRRASAGTRTKHSRPRAKHKSSKPASRTVSGGAAWGLPASTSASGSGSTSASGGVSRSGGSAAPQQSYTANASGMPSWTPAAAASPFSGSGARIGYAYGYSPVYSSGAMPSWTPSI